MFVDFNFLILMKSFILYTNKSYNTSLDQNYTKNKY